MSGIIPPSQALVLDELLAIPAHGIASRVVCKTTGGNVTMFAFDAGEGLSEHSAGFDALVVVLEGTLTLTVDRVPIAAVPGTITRLPAHVPHAVDATSRSRMMLIMLRAPDLPRL